MGSSKKSKKAKTRSKDAHEEKISPSVHTPQSQIAQSSQPLLPKQTKRQKQGSATSSKQKLPFTLNIKFRKNESQVTQAIDIPQNGGEQEEQIDVTPEMKNMKLQQPNEEIVFNQTIENFHQIDVHQDKLMDQIHEQYMFLAKAIEQDDDENIEVVDIRQQEINDQLEASMQQFLQQTTPVEDITMEAELQPATAIEQIQAPPPSGKTTAINTPPRTKDVSRGRSKKAKQQKEVQIQPMVQEPIVNAPPLQTIPISPKRSQSVTIGMQTEANATAINISEWKDQMMHVQKCLTLAIDGLDKLNQCMLMNSPYAFPNENWGQQIEFNSARQKLFNVIRPPPGQAKRGRKPTVRSISPKNAGPSVKISVMKNNLLQSQNYQVQQQQVQTQPNQIPFQNLPVKRKPGRPPKYENSALADSIGHKRQRTQQQRNQYAPSFINPPLNLEQYQKPVVKRVNSRKSKVDETIDKMEEIKYSQKEDFDPEDYSLPDSDCDQIIKTRISSTVPDFQLNERPSQAIKQVKPSKSVLTKPQQRSRPKLPNQPKNYSKSSDFKRNTHPKPPGPTKDAILNNNSSQRSWSRGRGQRSGHLLEMRSENSAQSK
ncbi:hypothetical protein FGO68_gene2671 [Halteria grandinella]|uniref:Uncharacterized protein n=1 Tax=Halteria grandinella TaxID=5974 RepID=A0A8J8NY69_HALGN|nr:hypothetical protein FGO68_gene2671 [Halteria grandinella]